MGRNGPWPSQSIVPLRRNNILLQVHCPIETWYSSVIHGKEQYTFWVNYYLYKERSFANDMTIYIQVLIVYHVTYQGEVLTTSSSECCSCQRITTTKPVTTIPVSTARVTTKFTKGQFESFYDHLMGQSMLVKHQSFCVSTGMNNVPSHQTYYKYYQGYSVVQSTETKWVIIDCRLIECLFYTNYFSFTVSTVSTTIPTPLVTTKGKSVLLIHELSCIYSYAFDKCHQIL